MLWTPTVKVSCDCCTRCNNQTILDLEKMPDSQTFWTELEVPRKLKEMGWKVIEEGNVMITISPYCEVPDAHKESV